MKNKLTAKIALVSGVLVIALSAVVYAQSQSGMRQGPMHGMMNHQDSDTSLRTGGQGMQRMMQGTDTTQAEERELALLFANHQLLSRNVTHLPNGIETLTESDNPELAAILISHVVGMINRADTGRDPGVVIQSPTLDDLFQNRGDIQTHIETTTNGIKVVQTASDPNSVKALHTHADEVTDMVERGMMSVHEAMMSRGPGH
ncbi:MAG: hypothetical protein LAT65_07525 [Saccharospirillum sp.]|nr:hypothetical protein [Saccharospirillum sp.]